ncbi:suppressor of fused domain protein [Mycolicibacterium sp. 018/SC-01/001]|uniref:suppressor of fused domain protein n=1 Tax=Mycolicibacterium sp. 018/SC-01/001 TaxID=2592069 RepID=UPI00117E02A1|nr:suppressor of fused domain protein [Mycolicibacterium sp. 018/SC-01/001]TRW79304.1 suppressor of fused domain protein [Mycolicibacterium sp. 018/SC-01/001]
MVDATAAVRARLLEHFAHAGEPAEASVTFLGADRVHVLRFGPDGGPDAPAHYVSLGCSSAPMVDPAAALADPVRGPRAEVLVALRGPAPTGLARSVAVVAAAPAVEGLILEPDALIDLETPLWQGAPFTAFLLGHSEISDVTLPEPASPVTLLSAVPITPTEAAWVRLKGAAAMREAWQQDGVDVTDPRRRAASPA